MENKTKILLSVIICMILLGIAIIPNLGTKKKYVEINPDASSVTKYEYDFVKVKNIEFGIVDIQYEDEGVLVQIDCNQDVMDVLLDEYSFYLGKDDMIDVRSGCRYDKDHTVYIVDLENRSVLQYNQIIILDNKRLKPQAIVNIENI